MLKRVVETVKDRLEKPLTNGILDAWQKLPARTYLETVADLYGEPVLIAHQNSTAVLYANEAAKKTLGQEIIGRTVDAAASEKSRMICANGEKVTPENHPVAKVKKQGGRLKADVVWKTEEGDKKFQFLAQKMFRANHALGDFYLLELRSAS